MIEISNQTRKHIIKYANGTKRTARLFQIGDTVYEFLRNSKSLGLPLPMQDVVDIKPALTKETEITRTRRFLKKACGYLEASGLWSDMLRNFNIIQSLDDETLGTILSGNLTWEEKTNEAKRLGLTTFTVDGYVDSLATTVKKGIKTINYNKWEKDKITSEFNEALKNNQDYKFFWRKGYDNSISLSTYNGQQVAHYSEEYKNCGNGHYYIALDAHHAIFCEDD